MATVLIVKEDKPYGEGKTHVAHVGDAEHDRATFASDLLRLLKAGKKEKKKHTITLSLPELFGEETDD